VTALPDLDPALSSATRRWTLVGDAGRVDVEVTASDAHTVGDVLAALPPDLRASAPTLWSGPDQVADDLPLATAGLGHGAVLGLGRPLPGGERGRRSSAVELHVVGGPDAGRSLPLTQGRHVVGRGGEVEVRLEDPDVSRSHVAVHVTGGQITVNDLGSTNGSMLDADPLGAEPRRWAAGATLRLGASALRIAGPATPPVPLGPASGGRELVRPAPRLEPCTVPVEVALPRPPTPPSPRRLAWVAMALPAVAGVFMAWLLATPTFLFFALLGPVVGLGTWASDRWSGHRSGRRKAAAHLVELAAAEERLRGALRAAVQAAELAAPDLATVVSAARRRTRPLWSRTRTDGDALTVRLGTGPGATAVVRVEPDGRRAPEPADHLPVCVDLRSTGGLLVVGPRTRALGVLRALIGQLAVLHAPGEVDVVVLCESERLADWAWARWLPHMGETATHVAPPAVPAPVRQRSDDAVAAWLLAEVARRRAAGRPAHGHASAPAALGWLVVIVDRVLDPRSAAALRDARSAGVVVLSATPSAAGVDLPVHAALHLGGETGDLAVLRQAGVADRSGVVVDRLPPEAADDVARHLAGLRPVTDAESLPSRVRLLDVPAPGLRLDDADRLTGAWSRERDQLSTPLGRTARGPLVLDLCRQGPHALVAGTTGAGKSELLQSLVAGLALHHPPDRCSFLLIDYKGGAAFAEAAALPHTVGVVTDLDGPATTRALRSLAAELTRREAVLAAAGVPDISALPDTVPLARLVIVVDEFAGLAEELPAFVPGLVAIAQRGRSLGVHLVLATQRPSGVVSPEIRANCTLRICLRTTDEAESRDVLGSPEAAHLPVGLPGRAYLRSGGGTALALQVARVAAPPEAVADDRPRVRRSTWPEPARPAPPAPGSRAASDLARIAGALAGHARQAGQPAPHRPWCPPLPASLPAEALGAGRPEDPWATRARLTLGLVDRPDGQLQEPLVLDLAGGGTWLAVGGPRSGRTTLLRRVLGEAVSRLGPEELHVHVLEADGRLSAEAAHLPHLGTAVPTADALRTVRLIDRLTDEIATRRAGGGLVAAPITLLLIDGVDAVCALLDEADPGRGATQLLRLLRDGAAVGLTCVLTGDRAVPGGRLAAVARHRLVLPLPDRADYALAGVPARAVPDHRPAGRALIGEEATECQLALPRIPATAAPPGHGGAAGTLPLRIVELPTDPILPAGVPAADPLVLAIGPGGDEGGVLTVDLRRSGGLLVVGPPGSGRSTALAALGSRLRAGGVPTVWLGRPGPRRGPGSATEGSAPETVVDPHDHRGLADWLDRLAGRAGVVLADDLASLAELPALAALGERRGTGPTALVAAGSGAQFVTHYSGPVAALRRNRTGLLLCPGPGDADALGIRPPRLPVPVRPGSGWLVTAGVPHRVQVARRRAAPGAVSTDTPAAA
jgi:S-DNA-T family DNA segregation ATPase FtsK/SpoIIIE